MINKYIKVKITTDFYKDRGIDVGSEGYVIESYDDGNYDVEFSNQQGNTIAILILTASEFDILN